MKVLLINPFVEKMHAELSYAANFRPPLGLGYVGAVLEEAGHQVRILDALMEGIRFPKLRAILQKERPDMVGLGIYSPTRYEGFRTADVVKETLGKDVLVVAGGPHPSASPEDTLQHVPTIDYLARGQGERTIMELVNGLESGSDLTQIPGLSGRLDGELFEGPRRGEIENPDEVPHPARHLLNIRRYGTRMPSTMIPSTTILTSRGCPARCVFCTRDWFTTATRFHSPERMADEVEDILKRYKMPGVIFQDDTFTLNKRRIFEFCEIIRQRNLKFSWLATTRVDCVNKELLEAMRDAGCKVVTFGVESMIQRTLDWLKKGITVEQAEQSTAWAAETGLIVRCSYLLGINDETEDEIHKSLERARKLPIHKLKANVGLSLYPGTPAFSMAIEQGILSPEYSFARDYHNPELRYGNQETPRWTSSRIPPHRMKVLQRIAADSALDVRPNMRMMMREGSKWVHRFRHHPGESARHVARFARSFVGKFGSKDSSRDTADVGSGNHD